MTPEERVDIQSMINDALDRERHHHIAAIDVVVRQLRALTRHYGSSSGAVIEVVSGSLDELRRVLESSAQYRRLTESKLEPSESPSRRD